MTIAKHSLNFQMLDSDNKVEALNSLSQIGEGGACCHKIYSIGHRF